MSWISITSPRKWGPVAGFEEVSWIPNVYCQVYSRKPLPEKRCIFISSCHFVSLLIISIIARMTVVTCAEQLRCFICRICVR